MVLITAIATKTVASAKNTVIRELTRFVKNTGKIFSTNGEEMLI